MENVFIYEILTSGIVVGEADAGKQARERVNENHGYAEAYHKIHHRIRPPVFFVPLDEFVNDSVAF